MFTGLVEALGEITEVKPTPGGLRLRVSTSLAPELANGDSLAVNGVCLTVVAADSDGVHIDVSPETARVTTLGALRRAPSSTSSGRCAPMRGSAATSSRGTSMAPAPSKTCGRTATRSG